MPRLTIRRLMIAVAALAVGLSCPQVYRLRARYVRLTTLADVHAEIANHIEKRARAERALIAVLKEKERLAITPNQSERERFKRGGYYKIAGKTIEESCDIQDEERRKTIEVSRASAIKLEDEAKMYRDVSNQYRFAVNHPWLALPPGLPLPK